MVVGVDGWRATAEEWEFVRSLPAGQLPGLTPEQREVARKLGFSEEDYARSILAGERSQSRLLKKAEWLARLLQERFAKLGARVERVMLRASLERFDAEIRVNGAPVPIRIREEIVDRYFERGSRWSERALDLIVDRIAKAAVQ
jgi:hypothetical protein